ncbi:hypothetical protein EsH8_VI_000088 [Colletotrichum jinshuiense]
MPADVLHLHGHGYHLLAPVAMRLPVEILHQIYTLLDPYDFNSSRHTCRAWFWAGMNRSVLVDMLKRGGWWSSVENILKMEQHLVPPKQNLDQTTIMSKWIARECTLGPRPGGLDPPFVEIGRTQFDGLGVSYSTSGTRKDTAIFTTSICGRCLIVSYGGIIYVYELNHNCRITGSHSSSASPWNQDQRHQKGLLRPVAAILCPHRVISCALDTSWGRYAIAAVLDGRNGFVCDITGLRTSFELSKGPSTQFVNNVGKFGVGAAMGNPHQPIAAVFPTTQWAEGVGFQSDKQLLVFYTIPPDMFRDISRFGNLDDLVDPPIADWAWWWPMSVLRAFDVAHYSGYPASNLFHRGSPYPIDIHGQIVAVWSGIVELALDSGHDMLI